MNNLLVSITVRNGVALSLVLCLYSVMMWLTRLDAEYLYIGQYLDMLVVIVPIFFTFRAIKQAMLQTNLPITHRLLLALGVGFVGYIIHAPYLYVYHNFINPDWFDAVVALEKQNLLAKNVGPQEIASKLQLMIDRNNAQNQIFKLNAFIASVFVLPLLIACISFIFIRKPKKSQ